MDESSDSTQYQLLTDTLARHLVARASSSDPSSASDDDDLSDFASFLSSELWPSLPSSLQSATHEAKDDVPSLDDVSLENLSPSFIESLVSYELVADEDRAEVFARRVIEDYLKEATAPPPVWKSTRVPCCELCDRNVPLTYHHLIPRSTHSKVLKKGWHHPSMINSVAWLCRQCHSAVHHVAPNEVLAREYYTVELLLERDDIQRWVRYASKQRWGCRPYRK